MKPLMTKTLLAVLGCMIFGNVCAKSDKGVTVKSPDGSVKLTVSASASECGEVTFALDYRKKRMLYDCRLGLETDRAHFAKLRLVSASEPEAVTEDYRMVQGKRLHCVNTSMNQTLSFVNQASDTLLIAFRVFNDGVAFQYRVNGAVHRVRNELTTYHIPDGVKRWMQNYDPGSEQFFPMTTDGKFTPVRRGGLPVNDYCYGYPSLLEPVESQFVLITESDITRAHSGSYLTNKDDSQRYKVVMADKEIGSGGLPGNRLTVSGNAWRVMIVGTLDKVVESTLVTDVASPAVTDRTDWIKPAPVSWIYWAYNHGSRELDIIKKYIDLAVDMHWPYMLIDAEWDEMTKGDSVQAAIQYAHERGVKPMLWYNSSTAWVNGAPGPKFHLNEKGDRRSEFKWLKKNGVAGIKVDFFDGDNSPTMDYCIDILEDALKYDLLVTLHGATVPRGWQRTYPNLMTVEGVYGAEWYNNTPLLTNKAAAHNATLPFTRNVIGPMDYTPGTFSDSQHPHITSHGHELALSFLFESPLQHMPDRPEAYAALPKEVRELLSQLPTAWDDTRLLGGYPANHVVMARRSGGKWYIAGINGTDEPMTLKVDLNKLPETDNRQSTLGKRKLKTQNSTLKTQNSKLKTQNSVTLFSDGPAQREFAPVRSITPVKGVFEVECLPRGGFVAVLEQ